MINYQIFKNIHSKYKNHASWAVWGSLGTNPKDNMDDLSIFDEPAIHSTLKKLQNNYVLVGLNISTIEITIPLSNFHGKNGEVYKLRYAIHDTPLSGSYMTDVLKDYLEAKSQSVEKYLKTESGIEFEKDNIEFFKNELQLVGASNATLIALGNATYKILLREFAGSKNIIKIPHYGWRVGKEKYRQAIHFILVKNNLM